MTEPSLFYTGMVADLYAELRGFTPDPEPYARFVGTFGQPALELGCGTGDPLLELRRRGLDVEGLDSSPDMLDRCRARAGVEGIEVVLHQSAIEDMDLGAKFRSIYLAGPTFNLLTDDAVAGRALERIAAHLEPGGAALVPLFIPQPVTGDGGGEGRTKTREDGTAISFSTVAAQRDDEARVQRARLRYETTADGETSVLEREWVLHWHTQDGFRRLSAAAGLTVIAVLDAAGRPAPEDAETFAFLLSQDASAGPPA